MADGFIVRKGGVAVDITAAPSINFVSKTFDSITFTITNNDTLTADIFWEIGDSTPDANTFSLAGGATSSNQVASGLDEEETYTIFAFANAEGKAGSQTTSQVRTTPEDPRIFTAATGGTTLEYDSGGKRFRSHTFLEDSNFVVSTVGDNIDDRNKVDYLIIAGAGSGGYRFGGGGGAGGFRTTLGTQGGLGTLGDKVTVTATTFGVIVGAGGTSITGSDGFGGNNGTNSSFDGVVSIAGGGGGSWISFSDNAPGKNGGSGGAGGPGQSDGARGTIGTGTANQGFNGGNGIRVSGNNLKGGGGGGAGEIGETAGTSNAAAGKGGNGLANLLRTGSNETRAGGGGGGAVGVSAGSGGSGGGGAGCITEGCTATSGTVNTGSGGGGGRFFSETASSGAGGSGIVVIRYEIATV